jgi:hypothetical protein
VTAPASARHATFIATKEHRRFVEFADAVRRDRYIGLCYGPAGVGKTLSARRYTHWDTAEPLLDTWGPRQDSDAKIYAALARSRTVFYTPEVKTTHKALVDELHTITARVDACIDQHVRTGPKFHGRWNRYEHVELLVIDEADRLSPNALEHLRDRFDRHHLGPLLIGMPGIEKRLAAYPQLYSRIRNAHQYRPLAQRRAHLRADPPLAPSRPDPRPRRLHRRPSHRRGRPHHPRQLPPPPPAIHPGRPHHEDQRSPDHHARSHRSRPRHPCHRRRIAPPKPRHLPPEITGGWVVVPTVPKYDRF